MLKAQARAQREQEATRSLEQQSTQGVTSTTEVRDIVENPQVIRVFSSSSLSGGQVAPLESHNPSVRLHPVVIQDSMMQSQTNMSDFLRASTAGYNLLDQFMANMRAHMDRDFEIYLSQFFNCDSVMIKCFNILLLNDEIAFRTFTDQGLESRLTSISYQAIGHPSIVPCVLFASAFEISIRN